MAHRLKREVEGATWCLFTLDPIFGLFDVGLGQVLAGSKFAFRILCLHSVEGEPRYTVAE
jgi:hypothetical protein